MPQSRRTFAVTWGHLAAMLALTFTLGAGIGYLVGRPSPEPELPLNTLEVSCTGILDGDTIRVNLQEQSLTVRMLGIDCPETKRGKKLDQQVNALGLTASEVESYGKQARNRTASQTSNTTVRLVFPGSPEQRDSFGRLLAYVEVDGRDVGRSLLESGLALEYPARHPRQAEYRAIIEVAQRQRRGLWISGKRKP